MRNWYLFTPEIGVIQDPSDPNQYSYLKGEPMPCISIATTGKVYAVKAFDLEGQPVIDKALLCELFVALQYKKDSENVMLRHVNFK